MKTPLSAFSFLVAFSACFLPNRARAQDDQQPPPPPPANYADQGDQQGPGPGDDSQGGASYQEFYDQLSNDGSWIQTDQYGYVFQPNTEDPDWQPYTDGSWAYTEDGWTWISADPWGWATDHYGRWAFIDGTGWVWIPGDEWAPAWVSWRFGDGYAGWAPLPPDTLYGYGGGEIGFHFGDDVDSRYHIGAGRYHFVRETDLGARNVRSLIMNREGNSGVFNRTTNVTNLTVNRSGAGRAGFAGVTAGGPPLAEVNAHSTSQIRRLTLAAGSAPGRSTVHGNSITVFAPHFNAGTVHQARPATVSRTLAVHSNGNAGTANAFHSTVNATPQVHTTTNVDRTESAHTGETFHPSSTSQVFHQNFQEQPQQQHFEEHSEQPQAQQHFEQPQQQHFEQPQTQQHFEQPQQQHFEQPQAQQHVENHNSAPQAQHSAPASHSTSAPASNTQNPNQNHH